MSFLICVDALKPSNTTIEQCYWMGAGSPYSPVLIDSVTDGQQASLISSATLAAFTYAGNLYKVVVGQQTSITLVCKSTNVGATWTRLDAANAPLFQFSAAYFDGDHTVIVAYMASNAAGSHPLQFQNFDLAAGTWSAVYGTTGAPSGSLCNTVWKRPDGSLLVLYQGTQAGGQSGLAMAVFAGGAWTVSGQDAGINITALTGWDATQSRVNTGLLSSVMDAAGNVHAFFNITSLQLVPVIWGNRCFYQQIKADNTTPAGAGFFFDFPGQVAPLTGGKQDLVVFSGSPLGIPVILTAQNKILLPTSQTNRQQTFPHQIAVPYIGSPISAPIWTTDNSKLFDPEVLTDTFITEEESPVAAFDGTTIQVLYTAQLADGTDFGRLRLCSSADLASPADGWSGETIFDLEVDSPPGFNVAGQALLVPSIFASASPVVARPPKITLRGVKRRKKDPCIPDYRECPPVPNRDRAI